MKKDFEFDPEGDLLQAQYEAESAAFRRDQKLGICHHGVRLGRKVPAFYSAEDIAKVVLPDRAAHYGNDAPFSGAEDEIPEGQVLCIEYGRLIPKRDA